MAQQSPTSELADFLLFPRESQRTWLSSGFANGFIEGCSAKALSDHDSISPSLLNALLAAYGDASFTAQVAAEVTGSGSEPCLLTLQFERPDGTNSRNGPALLEDPAAWEAIGYSAGYASAWTSRLVLCLPTKHSATPSRFQIAGLATEDRSDAEQLKALYRSAPVVNTPTKSAKDHPLGSSKQLLGRSPAFEDALSLLNAAAATKVTVLLTGETGVGKEQFARELHRRSHRNDKHFEAINCAAIPSELIESELFGVERGAYTGATTSRAGRIERADGGTLLLDEIGDLPLSAQAKLLRVLQFGEVERLGATRANKVDIRIIAATNVDLDEAVKNGRFRADLLFRLDVYRISIPPLRDRGSDITLLAKEILRRHGKTHGKQVRGFEQKAINHMCRYPWPGNIRELENRIERAVIITAHGGLITYESLFRNISTSSQLPPAVAGESTEKSTILQEVMRRGLTLPSLEDQLMKEAVAATRGNLAAAARYLGISRPQLSYRLAKFEERESVS